MKKFYYIFLFILVLFLPLIAIPQAQIQHNFNYFPDSLSLNTISIDTLLFTKVRYASEHNRTCDTGNPELPVLYYNFIIPIDKKANQVTLTNKVFSNFNISYPVYPVQKPIPLCLNCEAPGFCFPNAQIYSSSSVFPSDNVVSLNYGFFDRNCHILTIGICPFEYYPSLGQIRMLTSFDVTINLVPDTTPRSIIPIKRLSQSQTLYDQILFKLVENTDQISNFYSGSTIVEELGYTPSGLLAYEYVIITPNRFVSAFADFVVWKKQKGIDIGVVTIEDILSHYVGDVLFPDDAIYDNAGKLRQYLSEAHEQGTMYALLAGDQPDMPIRYGWTEDNTINNEYIIPTDLYFSDFSGNWNVDHDSCYGEFSNDAPDFTPEIYVGRLLCSSAQDIANWINKTILYEKTPGNGNASYLTHSFMTEADQCQFQEEAEEVASHLTMFNHTIWKESPDYNSTPPVFPKGSDIIQELNTHHYGLMSCFNHGGTGNGESGFATMMNGVGHNPQWKLQAQELHPYSGAMLDNNNGLDNLTNYNYPFVIYTVSCWICPFDRTSSINNNGARNTGESFTVDNLAGGIAFFGNNRQGIVGASKDLYLVFTDLLSEYASDQIYPRFGYLELISKSTHSLTATTQHTTPKYSCYNHNLIGDPECSLWTCIPENLSVSIEPQSAALNRNNCFQMTINNLDYSKNAVVTLYKEGDVYERQEVTGNQQNCATAYFTNINPSAVGDITFTVTSFGYLPYQEDIEVLNNCEITINSNETWQNNGFYNCDIVVNNGASLTVESNIKLSSDAKVIVKPGGRLIVDGGHLTSLCSEEMWPGIQVWGNAYADQYLNHGGYSQGYLELKNGATIENAVCAVALWHPGDWNSTGGIVFADSVFFHNNAKAVRALHYSQCQNGQELAYNSSFHNCTFTVDDDYLGTETFERHVHLYDISSLEFIGCHFSVDPEATGVSPWRCAIQADDAGFTATARCKDPNSYMTPQSCPDEYLERCSFTGFYNALYANNSGGSARTFTVSDAVFTGNDCGVRAENTGLATVIRNSFALGCGEDCAFGVYAQNTANHCIEENDFAPATGFMGATYGVGLFDCGGANDVYRNDFEGLTCGNLAVGVNTAKTEGLHGIVAQGLTYTCNTNTSNTVDFCVLKDENGGGSIRAQQGSSTLPAGNTFDASGYHFYNDGDDTVDYYYNGIATGQTPNISKIYRVNRISTNSTNPCLSHYGGGTVVKSPEEKAQLEDDFHSAQEDIDLLVSLYKRRLAAGGTADELADLRAQMAQRVHDRSMAAGDIVRSILNDTVTDHRELRTWLRNMGDLASDRLTIASYVQEGDFDGAFSLAQTLPSLYGLEGDELSDHANHLRLLGLHRALRQSGRTTTQLTDDERLMVEDIARAGYPYSGSLAAALLETGGLRGDDRSVCPELPRIADRGRGETGTEEREASDLKVTVTPNPASSQVTVEYILSEGSSRAMLSILNTLGEKMTELGLEGNRGSTVVDLRELPAGVYFFVVTDLNGRTSSGKVVKQ